MDAQSFFLAQTIFLSIPILIIIIYFAVIYPMLWGKRDEKE